MYDVEQIKKENSIADVISRYTKLSRGGSGLKCCCPFHDDHHPSMSVDPERGLWHCFTCNMGGDVITFIQEIEGVEFLEACRILGAQELPEVIEKPPRVTSKAKKPTLGRRERAALAMATRVYHAKLWSLPADSEPRQYLAKRRMEIDTIRRYCMGWCSGNDLLDAAKFAGVSAKTLEKAGLIVRHGDGYREWLAGRIVLAERDVEGVVYLMGRGIQESAIKYLGLKGMPKPIYGLATIDPQRPVAIVEGWFCMASLVQSGVQSIAVMGTGLRGHRVAALQPILRKIAIPQNDELQTRTRGGKEEKFRAAEEALRQWQEELPGLEVVRLPKEHKDVNDFLRDDQAGYQAWLDSWADWGR